MPNTTMPISDPIAARDPVSFGESTTDQQLLKQFAHSHDQAAFEALFKRHGPMVFGVCRRVLGDSHEAEDAFQAVFLVLVRKCRCIAKPELLANWLYGVAYRTALKAKVKAARRRYHTKQVKVMTSEQPDLTVAQRELHTVLDEELCALPQKYRAPLVLCYLQGKTHTEAARQLGWPSGSMSRRVAKACRLLRERLRRRNVALSLSALGLLLSRSAASAQVPSTLVQSTITAALVTAPGKLAIAEIVPASVAELVEEMLAAMSASKGKYALLALLPLLAVLGFAVWSSNIALSHSAASVIEFHRGAKPPEPELTTEVKQRVFPNGFQPCP